MRVASDVSSPPALVAMARGVYRRRADGGLPGRRAEKVVVAVLALRNIAALVICVEGGVPRRGARGGDASGSGSGSTSSGGGVGDGADLAQSSWRWTRAALKRIGRTSSSRDADEAGGRARRPRGGRAGAPQGGELVGTLPRRSFCLGLGRHRAHGRWVFGANPPFLARRTTATADDLKILLTEPRSGGGVPRSGRVRDALPRGEGFWSQDMGGGRNTPCGASCTRTTR